MRIAAVAAGPAHVRPDDLAAVLLAYEPLVAAAVRKGARLVALPADPVQVTEDSFPAWLAEVRHWSRQGQVWLVLGYGIKGGADRLVVVDPTGNIRAGCDLESREGAMAARFEDGLRLDGWRVSHGAGPGLLVLPRRLAERTGQSLVSTVAAMANRAHVLTVNRAGGWAYGPEGALLATGSTAAGSLCMLVDLQVAEG